MKKKIIIIAAVITVIASILTVSCFATDNSGYYGKVIEAGTTIVLKDSLEISTTVQGDIDFYTISSGTSYYNRIRVNSGSTQVYYENTSTSTSNARYGATGWTDQAYKTLHIREDYTIQDNAFGNWLIENTQSGLPTPSNPGGGGDNADIIDNVKESFETTLSITSIIIAWLMANELALIGLYLFILIALIMIAARFFKK